MDTQMTLLLNRWLDTFSDGQRLLIKHNRIGKGMNRQRLIPSRDGVIEALLVGKRGVGVKSEFGGGAVFLLQQHEELAMIEPSFGDACLGVNHIADIVVGDG